jgi:hypothetical protein
MSPRYEGKPSCCFEEVLDMGRTPKSGQDERGQARVAQPRQRWLELENDSEARYGRLDVAMADVWLAQDRRNEDGKATEQADARMGQAIVRILDEGVPMAEELAPAPASSGQPFIAGRGRVEGTNRIGGLADSAFDYEGYGALADAWYARAAPAAAGAARSQAVEADPKAATKGDRNRGRNSGLDATRTPRGPRRVSGDHPRPRLY